MNPAWGRPHRYVAYVVQRGYTVSGNTALVPMREKSAAIAAVAEFDQVREVVG
jgi:hypothetical protein